VRATTTEVLIIAEALHEQAAADMPRLIAAIEAELTAAWPAANPAAALLTAAAPSAEFHRR
jgi:DNA/RNA-binding domain of Phe-tRNA-synthetase-like protein